MKTFKNYILESTYITAPDGGPLIVYHGRDSKSKVFDPDKTGHGNDQLGSGFYFTDDINDAKMYSSDNGTVFKAQLYIRNPIIVDNEVGANLTASDVDITEQQAYEILKRSPKIYDPEESPLGDWIESYWETGPEDWMIKKVAQEYTGKSLITMENDFFSNHATIYRKVLHDVLGYDSVMTSFDNGIHHYVAWFPDQIEVIDEVN